MSRPSPPPWVSDREARRRLSVEGIVAAGLEILANEGLTAVTMRAVAGRLGTGAASLYAHVKDKDELHQLMLDEVIGEVEIPVADPAHWRDQLKDALRSQYQAMVRHPGIAAVNIAYIPTGPNALRCSEAMLAILEAGGLSPTTAGLAVDLLTLFPTAVAFEDVTWWHKAAEHPGTGIDEASVVAGLREFFAELPPARYPRLVAMASALTAGTGEDRFEFGLAVLVAGLEATRDWTLQG